jgi:hypothetical protein
MESEIIEIPINNSGKKKGKGGKKITPRYTGPKKKEEVLQKYLNGTACCGSLKQLF